MREGKKTLGAAAALLLLAALFTACGGSDGSGSSATSTGQAQSAGESGESGSGQGEAKGGGGQGGSSSGKDGSGGDGKSGGSGGDASDFVPKQHDDAGGGSGQYRVKGGDNSVQEFGGEAGAQEFDAAAVALHNFLDARAEGNWDAACQYMSKTIIKGFEELVARAKGIQASDCGEILQKLTNPAAKQSMKAEAAKANAGSLRTEGDRSFLIYTGTEGTILAMPMTNEDGTWKVASLAGTPLN